MTEPPLAGTRVVSLAINLPGPAAAARLAALGASVTKVEPPAGDPMRAFSAGWYEQLIRGQTVVTLDLKDPAGRADLARRLDGTDLLVTSHRPSALARLGLDWAALHQRHPRLCQVAIVGHPGPGAEIAGHDLTYQAAAGVLSPPALPTVLVADLAGAERAVADGLATLVERARTGLGAVREVALSQVADDLAEPLRRGLTAPGGILGGGLPGYRLYPAAAGHVAVAALEPHFWQRLTALLGLPASGAGLAAVLATRTAGDWQRWAAEHDVPLVALPTAPG
jgi:crotonobetainyl-CoA:carnitine CoA-transferase CaiB-like acyl-CoA transferase